MAVGFVRGPHGIQGELSIEPMTDFPDRFVPGAVLLAGKANYTISAVRIHKKGLLVTLAGITTRNQAEVLRGKLFEVAESDLPDLAEDQYFRFDIVGIDVVDENGTSLGKVADVLETGANDVYIVRDEESELLIPAIDSVVKEIDTEARRMVVDVIPGLERRALKRPSGD